LTRQPLYSDAELAELVRNSDADAFRSLFERFIRALVYFGIKLTGDQQESEDAASEAFQKLWQKREDMRGFPEMRAYLFSIVHNRSLNFIKRRSMMKTAHQSILAEGEELTDSSITSRIIQAETMVAIYGAIDKLPQHQRDLLYNIYIEELSTTDLARTMGTTPAHIRTAKARALASLREILSNETLLKSCIIFFFLFSAKKF
jgi:RNA polymerase sigma-70 factor (ECF subfamily)